MSTCNNPAPQYVLYAALLVSTLIVCCSCCGCYLCSELFPTLIRSAVLGYQNQAARVGGIVAPFIVMASAQDAGGGTMVPFLTFGAASVLAALLIFTLPETLGVPLPDTMEVRDLSWL
jgi:OCT family organic cation transporter-like MFS transporter 4/5